MKTVKPAVPTQATTLGASQQPRQLSPSEESMAHRARCQAIQAERAKTLLADMEIVFEFKERGHIGIGYQASTGKLVEFGIPRAGSMEDIEDTHWISEISLADSLAWVEKMEWASRRLDMCAQHDADGYLRWLGDVRAEIAA